MTLTYREKLKIFHDTFIEYCLEEIVRNRKISDGIDVPYLPTSLENSLRFTSRVPILRETSDFIVLFDNFRHTYNERSDAIEIINNLFPLNQISHTKQILSAAILDVAIEMEFSLDEGKVSQDISKLAALTMLKLFGIIKSGSLEVDQLHKQRIVEVVSKKQGWLESIFLSQTSSTRESRNYKFISTIDLRTYLRSKYDGTSLSSFIRQQYNLHEDIQIVIQDEIPEDITATGIDIGYKGLNGYEFDSDIFRIDRVESTILTHENELVELEKKLSKYKDAIEEQNSLLEFHSAKIAEHDDRLNIHASLIQQALTSSKTKAENPISLSERLMHLYALQDVIPNLIEDESVSEQKMEDYYVNLQILLGDKISGDKLPITVETIFDRIKDSPIEAEKILVLGGAGIGKTTLLNNIAYRWGREGLFSQFKYVFKIRLKLLLTDWKEEYSYAGEDLVNNPLKYFIHYSLMQDIHLFSEQGDLAVTVSEISLVIQSHLSEALFLFTGYDEIAQLTTQPGIVKNIIANIFKLKYIILDSRKNALTSHYEKRFDRYIENEGFNHDGTREYIEKYFNKLKEKFSDPTAKDKVEIRKQHLLDLLERNSNVRELSATPLNIALLCLISSDDHQATDRFTHNFNLGILYREVIIWLGKRYMTKIDPTKIIDVNTDPQAVLTSGMFKSSEVFKALKTIAYASFKDNKLVLEGRFIASRATDIQLNIVDVNKFGLLRIDNIGKAKVSNDLINQDHVFIHLSFQEYLTAHYFVDQLLLPVDDPRSRNAAEFIANHRNEPRYLNILKFAAGLIVNQGEELAVRKFWEAILCMVDGVIETGIDNKVILLMHLLEQSEIDGEFDTRIPYLEKIRELIDVVVCLDVTRFHDQITQSGYASLKIMEAALSILEFNNQWKIEYAGEVVRAQGEFASIAVSYLKKEVRSVDKYNDIRDLAKVVLNSNNILFIDEDIEYQKDATNYEFQVSKKLFKYLIENKHISINVEIHKLLSTFYFNNWQTKCEIIDIIKRLIIKKSETLELNLQEAKEIINIVKWYITDDNIKTEIYSLITTVKSLLDINSKVDFDNFTTINFNTQLAILRNKIDIREYLEGLKVEVNFITRGMYNGLTEQFDGPTWIQKYIAIFLFSKIIDKDFKLLDSNILKALVAIIMNKNSNLIAITLDCIKKITIKKADLIEASMFQELINLIVYGWVESNFNRNEDIKQEIYNYIADIVGVLTEKVPQIVDISYLDHCIQEAVYPTIESRRKILKFVLGVIVNKSAVVSRNILNILFEDLKKENNLEKIAFGLEIVVTNNPSLINRDIVEKLFLSFDHTSKGPDDSLDVEWSVPITLGKVVCYRPDLLDIDRVFQNINLEKFVISILFSLRSIAEAQPRRISREIFDKVGLLFVERYSILPAIPKFDYNKAFFAITDFFILLARSKNKEMYTIDFTINLTLWLENFNDIRESMIHFPVKVIEILEAIAENNVQFVSCESIIRLLIKIGDKGHWQCKLAKLKIIKFLGKYASTDEINHVMYNLVEDFISSLEGNFKYGYYGLDLIAQRNLSLLLSKYSIYTCKLSIEVQKDQYKLLYRTQSKKGYEYYEIEHAVLHGLKIIYQPLQTTKEEWQIFIGLSGGIKYNLVLVAREVIKEIIKNKPEIVDFELTDELNSNPLSVQPINNKELHFRTHTSSINDVIRSNNDINYVYKDFLSRFDKIIIQREQYDYLIDMFVAKLDDKDLYVRREAAEKIETIIIDKETRVIGVVYDTIIDKLYYFDNGKSYKLSNNKVIESYRGKVTDANFNILIRELLSYTDVIIRYSATNILISGYIHNPSLIDDTIISNIVASFLNNENNDLKKIAIICFRVIVKYKASIINDNIINTIKEFLHTDIDISLRREVVLSLFNIAKYNTETLLELRKEILNLILSEKDPEIVNPIINNLNSLNIDLITEEFCLYVKRYSTSGYKDLKVGSFLVVGKFFLSNNMFIDEQIINSILVSLNDQNSEIREVASIVLGLICIKNQTMIERFYDQMISLLGSNYREVALFAAKIVFIKISSLDVQSTSILKHLSFEGRAFGVETFLYLLLNQENQIKIETDSLLSLIAFYDLEDKEKKHLITLAKNILYSKIDTIKVEDIIWLTQNYHSLINFSSETSNFFQKLSHKILSVEQICEVEKSFLIKMIEGGKAISISDDSCLIFEGKIYKFINSELYLNDIRAAILSQKDDILVKQCIDHKPLFPNTGIGLMIATEEKDNEYYTSHIINDAKGSRFSSCTCMRVMIDQSCYKNSFLRKYGEQALGRLTYELREIVLNELIPTENFNVDDIKKYTKDSKTLAATKYLHKFKSHSTWNLSIFARSINYLFNSLDLVWQFKKFLYYQDILKFNTILKNNKIEQSINILKDYSSFKKSVLLKLHPDKGGSTEDFAFIKDLQEKFTKELDLNKLLNDKMQEVQPLIYKTTIGFKMIDTAVDVARLAYIPTLESVKRALFDSVYIYSMYTGVNGYSSIITGADIVCKLYNGENAEAIDQFKTSASFMLLPLAIGYAENPYIAFGYIAAITALTVKNTITNVYSFYQEYYSEDFAIRSYSAYKNLFETMSYFYDFSLKVKEYEIKIAKVSLEAKGEFGQKLFNYIYAPLIEEKCYLQNRLKQGILTQEESEILKAKHIKIENYDHCMENVHLREKIREHYHCYNEELKIMDHVIVFAGQYIEETEIL